MTRVVALLTDFGVVDPYVGMMKGVLLSLAANLAVVDLCHGIPPQAIASGAFWLESSYRYFPSGTIFVAVVDPGVGTERRAILVETKAHVFLAPDNGLLTPLLRTDRVVRAFSLERAAIETKAAELGANVARRGRTFDGRDLFAKAAGLLARGIAPEQFAGSIEPRSLVQLAEEEPDVFVVVAVDRFGNLLSNATWTENEPPSLEWNGSTLRFVSTYADASEGELVVLVSSSGTLEIATPGASAAELTGLTLGARLPLTRRARV